MVRDEASAETTGAGRDEKEADFYGYRSGPLHSTCVCVCVCVVAGADGDGLAYIGHHMSNL